MYSETSFTRNGRHYPLSIFTPKDVENPYLIVFTHGGIVSRQFYQETGDFLADAGYLCLMPSIPRSYVMTTKNFLTGIKDTMNFALEKMEKGSMSFNADAIGLAGHSMGANTSLAASIEDKRIGAVVCLAPSQRNDIAGIGKNVNLGQLGQVKAPVQLQIGTEDRFCSVKRVDRYYKSLHSDKSFVKFLGGTHSGFFDYGFDITGSLLENIAGFVALRVNTGIPEYQRSLAMEIMKSWFDQYLKGKSDYDFRGYVTFNVVDPFKSP